MPDMENQEKRPVHLQDLTKKFVVETSGQKASKLELELAKANRKLQDLTEALDLANAENLRKQKLIDEQERLIDSLTPKETIAQPAATSEKVVDEKPKDGKNELNENEQSLFFTVVKKNIRENHSWKNIGTDTEGFGDKLLPGTSVKVSELMGFCKDAGLKLGDTDMKISGSEFNTPQDLLMHTLINPRNSSTPTQCAERVKTLLSRVGPEENEIAIPKLELLSFVLSALEKNGTRHLGSHNFPPTEYGSRITNLANSPEKLRELSSLPSSQRMKRPEIMQLTEDLHVRYAVARAIYTIKH